jgi:uncharacterized protein (TIGR02453 family)
MTFTGFPIEALDFYEDLENDNSRGWWTEHKPIYERSVRQPMSELLAALEPEFGTGTVFRPYRDIRFAKDKSPYKTHQGAFVEVGPGTGYYVQVDASGLLVGGGFHAHTPDQLALYRDAVDDDRVGAQLDRIVRTAAEDGFAIEGDRLKSRPRGYPADHPRIELLRHRTLTAGRSFGSPAWLNTPRCAEEVAGAWRALTPLVGWLRDHVCRS